MSFKNMRLDILPLSPLGTYDNWEPKTVFSDDRKYRYVLYRQWNPDKPLIAFIGLNPSTADETNNDPTIRRMIGFAQQWGYGGLLVGNIFALRSTDPKKLYTSRDPVGPENDQWLLTIELTAAKVIACWGTHGKLHNRHQICKVNLWSSEVLGLTKKGFPKHPLYLKKTIKPVKWVKS
jgi:hypothetical protein